MRYRAIPKGFPGAHCPKCMLAPDQLTTAAIDPEKTVKSPRPDLPIHPDTIGLYRILEPIGEGGMGQVFVAEEHQEKPIRRKVALKLIKPGMDSREILIRFEAERQAVALMNHSNIARVYDAGTTQDGRPYFVMELVEGRR